MVTPTKQQRKAMTWLTTAAQIALRLRGNEKQSVLSDTARTVSSDRQRKVLPDTHTANMASTMPEIAAEWGEEDSTFSTRVDLRGDHTQLDNTETVM